MSVQVFDVFAQISIQFSQVLHHYETPEHFQCFTWLINVILWQDIYPSGVLVFPEIAVRSPPLLDTLANLESIITCQPVSVMTYHTLSHVDAL